jgi:hypothetical protein
MWDHCNDVRLKTITPAKQRRITALNWLVADEYDQGTEGLQVKDHHWLSKPQATIIQYDYNRKEQWAKSIQLARVAFLTRRNMSPTPRKGNENSLPTGWLYPPAIRFLIVIGDSCGV